MSDFLDFRFDGIMALFVLFVLPLWFVGVQTWGLVTLCVLISMLGLCIVGLHHVWAFACVVSFHCMCLFVAGLLDFSIVRGLDLRSVTSPFLYL